jgi:type I restriction enzyme, S subunit
MSEWRSVKISEVSQFYIGGTPARAISQFWIEKPDGHPWISIADLKEKFISETAEHISDAGAQFSNVKEIPPNTVVMSFKLSIGKTAITTRKMFCNEAIVFFQPGDELSPRWLYHAIPRGANNVVVDTAVKGATLNKKKIAEIILHLPAMVEQEAIADILDTLDKQIRHTEAIIAKLQQLKQGLLHDLLTRGIDANGQLRPAREQAPQLYKASPLGWIPREWDLEHLSSKAAHGKPHIKTGPFGSALKGEHWVQEGCPVITIGSLGIGELLESELLYIADKDEKRLADYALQSGEIVFSRVADVGRSVVIGDNQAGWIMSSNLMKISLDTKLVNPQFLQYQLAHEGIAKLQIRRFVNSAGRDVANSATLNQLLFLWPEKEEQNNIVERVDAFDIRLDAEKNELTKLKKQKSGLMDDLLSGRVRVTELLKRQQAS